MSLEATQAVWGTVDGIKRSTLPELRRRLVEEVPAKRRPRFEVAALVDAFLADRHRLDRGYVNETVGQIATALDLKPAQVKVALEALDALGIWPVAVKGNQHEGTRRTAGFLAEHGGADPADQETEHGGLDPAQRPNEHGGLDPAQQNGARRGSAPSSAGYVHQLGGVDPTTPRATPRLPRAAAAADDPRTTELDDLAAGHFERHLSYRGSTIRNPGGYRNVTLPKIRDAIAAGDDLETNWPTSDHRTSIDAQVAGSHDRIADFVGASAIAIEVGR